MSWCLWGVVCSLGFWRWSLLISSAMVFVPKSHTTSPCGGCRSLFFASAKKTNEKKADPAGSRAIRLMRGGGFVVRPGVLAGVSYRPKEHHNCMTHGLRRAAPGLACGARSHICRSRCEVLRRFGCGWFRGFVLEGKRRGCEHGPADRATVPPRNQRGVKQGAARAGTAGHQMAGRSPPETKPRNHHGRQDRGAAHRERQMPERSPSKAIRGTTT